MAPGSVAADTIIAWVEGREIGLIPTAKTYTKVKVVVRTIKGKNLKEPHAEYLQSLCKFGYKVTGFTANGPTMYWTLQKFS